MSRAGAEPEGGALTDLQRAKQRGGKTSPKAWLRSQSNGQEKEHTDFALWIGRSQEP